MFSTFRLKNVKSFQPPLVQKSLQSRAWKVIGVDLMVPHPLLLSTSLKQAEKLLTATTLMSKATVTREVDEALMTMGFF